MHAPPLPPPSPSPSPSPPMGCGISRFNLVDEGMACGLRPLRRRIDEVRRSDRAAADVGTTSTKLLLKDNIYGEGEAVVDSNDGRKSVSNATAVVIMKEPALQQIRVKEEEEAHALNCDGSAKERGIMETDQKKHGTNKEEATEWDKVDDVYEEEEDEGRRISDFDGSLWIGSPSFREYCVGSDSEDSINDGGEFHNPALTFLFSCLIILL